MKRWIRKLFPLKTRSVNRSPRLTLLALEGRDVPATLTVTTAADTGAGSLRNAIGIANLNGEADSIVFQAGLGTITLTSGELLISDTAGATTITGPAGGTQVVTRSGSAANFRIFNIASNVTASLSGLTISNGRADPGAGIYNNKGTLTLANSTVTGNTPTGGLINNGGGLYNYGKATITDCLFSSNSSQRGGGIDNAGSLSIANSTFTANSAVSGSGGGINSFNSGSTLTNVTLSANAAAYYGGGFNGGGTFQNCTISGNNAFKGGGIAATGTLTLTNTLAAGNKGNLGAADDVFASVAAASSNNLIGVNTNLTGITNGSNGNQIGTAAAPIDAKLTALGSYGGPTQTFALLEGSPAYNAGATAGAADQRGRPRAGAPDIGAFERQTVVMNVNNAGDGSLRAAIAEAVLMPGTTDTITFDAAFNSAKTIILASPLFINESMTITAPAGNLVTLSGNKAVRIMTFDQFGHTLTLNNLTFANGKAFSINFGGGGGLEISNGNATLTNCHITGNSTDRGGGGIYIGNVAAVVTITGGSIRGNSASAPGGGISNRGSLTLNGVTIDANTTATQGGGIFSRALTMTNSTVSNNSAGIRGGGVLLSDPAVAGFAITNSTVANNTAANGAGIALGSSASNPFNGTLVLRNATVTGNSTPGTGGGVALLDGTGTLDVDSSIVSGNLAATGPDISSAKTVTADFSAIGSNSGFTFTGANNLPFSTDLKLGSLADNGGGVKTFFPAADSPVLDVGSNVGSLSTDARGSGFPRVLNTQADIGAVEVQDFVVRNANDAGKDSLRARIADANSLAGIQTITFDPAVFGAAKTITLASTLSITDGVTITGPAGNTVTLSGNNSVRIMVAATSNGTFTLNNLNLVNGSSNSGGPGLRVSTTNTVLNNCVISGNTAIGGGGVGGGIYASGSANTLTFNLCTISGNSAGAYGGGIAAHTLLTLDGCTVANNTAANRAGGVYARIMTMANSTVRNNSAAVFGGGILLNNGASFVGTFSITNSTLTENTAADGAGLAIGYSIGDGATSPLLLRNSTITANSASGSGGGLRLVDGTSVFTIDSTILSGNTAATAPDVSSTGTVNVNRSALGSTAGFTLTGANNLVGQNLKLGTLGNYGGPVATIPLLAGSPAINAGSNPASLATDARGLPRVVGTAADIGTFEVQPAVSKIAFNTPTVSDANVGLNGYTVTTTFNMPMNTIVQPTIAFPAEVPAGSITFSSGTWIDSMNWLAKFQVADLGTTLNDIDLQISGAKDSAAGVVHQPYTALNAVDLDTQNAVIASITSTTPNGTYAAGQAVNITLNFSEPVNLVGTLNVTLDTGAVVSFAAQSGPSLSGTYNVAAGQNSPELNVTAISLAGGSTLRDAATNDSVLALPVSNLANNKAIVVGNATPTVTSLVVNNGDAQRSRLTKIVVNFNAPVSVAALGAISLTRSATVVNAGNGLIVSPGSGTTTSLTLTFGAGPAIESGSLSDGRWQLTIPGVNYTSTLNDPNLRRLFGDADANGTVDGSDLGGFGVAFGQTVPNSPFDFNADGTIDALDFGEFGNRFGMSL